MIYDCFLFHNELDLLEIRLTELDPFVDRFILVSSLETHSGNERVPCYFLHRIDRFGKWENKIFLILLSHLIGDSARDRQSYQRDAMAAGLLRCSDDDLIMLSDVDEIPRGEKISEFDRTKEVGVFVQSYRYYYLNGIVPGSYWNGTKITSYGFLRDHLGGSLEALRRFGHPDYVDPRLQSISDGGWHFTLLGGPERIRDKIQSFGAQQYNTEEFTDKAWIREAIETGTDIFKRSGPGRIEYVSSDKDLPGSVVQNPGRYAELMR